MAFRNEVLSLWIFLFLLPFIYAQSAIVDFYLKFDPKPGQISPEVDISWIQVSYGMIDKPLIPDPINSSEKYYRLELEYNGSTLISEKFGVPIYIKYIDYNPDPTLVIDYYPPPNKRGKDTKTARDFLIVENATELEFILPFYHHSQIIKIYRDNKLIFSEPLSKYLCNQNNKCDLGEDYLSCASDCKSGSKDNLCDRLEDGVCDPDCYAGFDRDCQNQKSAPKEIITLEEIKKNDVNVSAMQKNDNNILILILFVVFSVLALGFYLYWKKRK